MAESQNGWIVPPPSTRVWVVPGTNVELVLRAGAVGFILCHLALWYHERVESLTKGHPRDDWGGAHRRIRGGVALSNHASFTAMDLNATRHPLGARGTLKWAWRYARIHARLRWYSRVIRWGGDYAGRADEMHYEINRGVRAVERLARRLARTPRGKRVLCWNRVTRAEAVKA